MHFTCIGPRVLLLEQPAKPDYGSHSNAVLDPKPPTSPTFRTADLFDTLSKAAPNQANTTTFGLHTEPAPYYRHPVRKRALIVSASAIAVAIIAALFWPDQKEPEYQGKKLSDWLMTYYKHEDETKAAVRSIGNRATPLLLKWIRENDPAKYAKRKALYRKFPDWAKKSTLVKSWAGETNGGAQGRLYRAHGASIAFEILGPKATPAIPQLSDIFLNSRSDQAAGWAGQSLAFLGKGALPPLLQALKNSAVENHRTETAAGALRYMAYLGPDACPAVPALVHHSTSGDLGYTFAQQALENFATDPSLRTNEAFLPPEARPGHIGEPAADPVLRRTTVLALQHIGSNGTHAIWAKKVAAMAMEDSDPSVREAATNTLEQLQKDLSTPASSAGQ